MNNEKRIGMEECVECGEIRIVEDCIPYYEDGLHPETLKYFCSHGCLGMHIMGTANENRRICSRCTAKITDLSKAVFEKSIEGYKSVNWYKEYPIFCSQNCATAFLNSSEKTEPGKIINTNAKNSKNEFNYDELTTLLVLVQVEIIASGNLLIFADHSSGTYNEITDRIDSLVILRDKITNKLISFNFVAA